MASRVWDFVEGVGITPFHQLPQDISFFTEITVSETAELPPEKPDIEQLLSVLVDVEILSTRLVKTPVSTSYEGQHLAGLKLIIELKLLQKIKYVADKPTQSVHAAHFEKIVSSAFVILPQEYDGISMEDLYTHRMLEITPYIEDIYASKLSQRKFYKDITLLIDAKPNIKTV